MWRGLVWRQDSFLPLGLKLLRASFISRKGTVTCFVVFLHRSNKRWTMMMAWLLLTFDPSSFDSFDTNIEWNRINLLHSCENSEHRTFLVIEYVYKNKNNDFCCRRSISNSGIVGIRSDIQLYTNVQQVWTGIMSSTTVLQNDTIYGITNCDCWYAKCREGMNEIWYTTVIM